MNPGLTLRLDHPHLPHPIIVGLGAGMGALFGVLLVSAASELSQHVAPGPPATFAHGFANAIAAHPIVTFSLSTLVLAGLITIISRETKEFSLFWGAVRATAPESLYVARDAIARAERLRETAEDIVSDFATFTALVTPLVDSPSRPEAIDVLNKLCELASRTVGGGPKACASIWLMDEKLGKLRIVASYRVSPHTARRLHLAPGQGLAGQTFQFARPKAIPDVEGVDAGEYARDPDSIKPARSALGYPIYSSSHQKDLAGALCVSHSSARPEDRLDSEAIKRALPCALLVSHVVTVMKAGGIEI